MIGGRANLPGRYARLTTSAKMVVALVAALLPFGLIAILAALASAQDNRVAREREAQALVSGSARLLDNAITRTALTLRAASTALANAEGDPSDCRTTLAALTRGDPYAARYAVYTPGHGLLCATGGFVPPRPAVSGEGTVLEVSADRLRVVVAAGGEALGVADFPRAAVAALSHPEAADGTYRLVLRQGQRGMPLGEFAGEVQASKAYPAEVANGMAELLMIIPDAPVTATEVLLVLLPLLMLVAATVIGLVVMERLLLRPLKQLRAAVGSYRLGDDALAIPTLATPAEEIRSLAEAFTSVTARIREHERELEEGLSRQTRLTREVHHRVKNNLQVVASLINLHARGARGPEAAEAYASIQRRVDALAVVHRNHYAELEENRGVALRPLIGEIAANLRASAPQAAASTQITLELDSLYATQDVAVPVAFLITEVVEMAMMCDPGARIAISLDERDVPDRARLSLRSTALIDNLCEDEIVRERFDRVTHGLSRQLRAGLEHDRATGLLAIDISVVPPSPDADR